MHLPIQFIIFSIVLSPLWWTVAHTRATSDVPSKGKPTLEDIWHPSNVLTRNVENVAPYLPGGTQTNEHLQNHTLHTLSKPSKRAPFLPPIFRWGRPKKNDPDTTWGTPGGQEQKCRFPKLARRFNVKRACDDDDDNTPGNLQETVEDENAGPQPMDVYVNRGARVQTLLGVRLTSWRDNHAGTTNKAYSKNAFVEKAPDDSNDGGYKLKEETEIDAETANEHLFPTLAQLEIDKSAKPSQFTSTQVYTVDTDLEVSTTYISEDGILVNSYSFLKYDKGHYNDVPEHKRITQWSEITHQMLTKRYPDASKMPKINTIIQDSVVNVETRTVLRRYHEVFADKKVPAEQDNQQGSWVTFNALTTDPKEAEAVQAIIGTPNGNGVGYLLADYPSTFNGKTIVQIDTWSPKSDRGDAVLDEVDPGRAEVVFRLGDFLGD